MSRPNLPLLNKYFFQLQRLLEMNLSGYSLKPILVHLDSLGTWHRGWSNDIKLVISDRSWQCHYGHCKWVALCCWNFAIFCIWPRPHLHEHLTEQGIWSGMSTRIGDENEIGVATAKEMFHEADHLHRLSVQQIDNSDFLPFKDTGPTHKLHCLRPPDGLMLSWLMPALRVLILE